MLMKRTIKDPQIIQSHKSFHEHLVNIKKALFKNKKKRSKSANLL